MIKSPLSGWLGGKYRLANKIVSRIPEHTCYCEPFAGAAWVLFAKDPSPSEVLNDWQLDIVNLYRVLQNHLEEFVRYFKWVLISRSEFERLKSLEPTALTDIQRAARFYYIQKSCFGGRVISPSFGTSAIAPPKLNLLRIEEELSAVHLRLSRVLIEHLPYSELIERYDRPTTFFYLDPPYWGCEDDYGKDLFTREDFGLLAEQLQDIKGRFLLSLNDVPEVRATFWTFKIESVSTKYTVGNGPVKDAAEVFIRNF